MKTNDTIPNCTALDRLMNDRLAIACSKLRVSPALVGFSLILPIRLLEHWLILAAKIEACKTIAVERCSNADPTPVRESK